MLARTHLARGSASAALPLFERLARDCPRDMPAHLYLAWCYQALGRLAESRQMIEDLIRTGGGPFTELLMGELHLREGRPVEALKNFERAALERRDPLVSLLTGCAYLRLKRADAAEQCFRDTLEAAPATALAYLGLAISALRKRQSGCAAEAALAAINLKFRPAPAHFVLGQSLRAIGETARAIQAFETCLRLRPDDPAARAALHALTVHA
jgi:tetratricopeptide (TPR) repeat protein